MTRKAKTPAPKLAVKPKTSAPKAAKLESKVKYLTALDLHKALKSFEHAIHSDMDKQRSHIIRFVMESFDELEVRNARKPLLQRLFSKK